MMKLERGFLKVLRKNMKDEDVTIKICKLSKRAFNLDTGKEINIKDFEYCAFSLLGALERPVAYVFLESELDGDILVQLTHRGLHRWSFQWDKIKNFLIKSVLVPIAVALITTCVTMLITSSL